MNHLSNEEATKTNKIYHSCYTTNTDRTRIRVNFMNGERCVIPSIEKHWKKTEQPTIPHINSETNPPPPIINVVCKYLRQFRDTSFSVATLPIYCNIE